jgi:cytochrome c-type biogenesis protein CcmH/NrfG
MKALRGADAMPAEERVSALEAHYQGVGFMEHYAYAQAVEAFRKVHRLAPEWTPGAINLAIALIYFRDSEHGTTSHEEALTLLAKAPDNLSARYCRGMIFNLKGELHMAHEEFQFVNQHDPDDADTWVMLGSTLTDPRHHNKAAGPEQAQELIAIYTKALEQNPFLLNALYKL